MFPVSALNTTVHYQVVPKTIVEKFSFSELKIEKGKYFTQSLTQIFCISVFNVGVCLASCITFRPFLTLDPLRLGCLLKKTCNIQFQRVGSYW